MIPHTSSVKYSGQMNGKVNSRNEATRLFLSFIRVALLRLRGASIPASSKPGGLNIQGAAKNVFIGTGCVIDDVLFQAYERIIIGDDVVINSGAKLLTGSHDIHSKTYNHKCAPICVEDAAIIGSDALILPGVTVGKGAMVEAGAVISKDVPAFSVIRGNPAKIVGVTNTEESSSVLR